MFSFCFLLYPFLLASSLISFVSELRNRNCYFWMCNDRLADLCGSLCVFCCRYVWWSCVSRHSRSDSIMYSSQEEEGGESTLRALFNARALVYCYIPMKHSRLSKKRLQIWSELLARNTGGKRLSREGFRVKWPQMLQCRGCFLQVTWFICTFYGVNGFYYRLCIRALILSMSFSGLAPDDGVLPSDPHGSQRWPSQEGRGTSCDRCLGSTLAKG